MVVTPINSKEVTNYRAKLRISTRQS